MFGLCEVLVGLGRLVKVKGFGDQGFAVVGGQRIDIINKHGAAAVGDAFDGNVFQDKHGVVGDRGAASRSHADDHDLSIGR